MQYFNALESKLQPATLNLHKSALVKCIKAQMGGNSILKNLAIEKAFELIEVYKPDRSVSSGDCVTEKKIKAMVENAPSKKTGLIIQFLYKTGCRVGEMINIRLSDCELINGYMRIRIIGKGKKVRKITIPLELYREVRREYGGKTWLFESRGGNPLNRDNVGYQIRKAAKRIGLENFHTHLIRHSRATDMLKHKEITLTAVSKFLGHASVATTAEMYVHDEVNYHELFSKDSI
jgi:integrase